MSVIDSHDVGRECREWFRAICLAGLAGLICSAALAQDADVFRGKTITMIVGYASGGGTDAFGRLAASFLTSYLPGAPTVVVRNVPGADGITAMNYMVQQAAPDGLTITMASSTTANPLQYRKPQAHFDPLEFGIVGGAGRGGDLLVINREAEQRLFDKARPPVVMGSLGGVPRSGMQMTAWGIEYLGWNAKWVVGYRGTNELILALERGEIDMTSTSNLFQLQKLTESGRFRVLVQAGMLRDGAFLPRPELTDTPTLATLMRGRLADPMVAQAFTYWGGVATMDKWLALPPRAPPAMRERYVAAFDRMIRDPEFLDRGRRISEDFAPMSHREVDALVGGLASTPQPAIDFFGAMLARQGLQVQ
jgi:tripartite-type tricarboxylate transporter receptor subunit TctC